jgi:ABC-type sulfate/molybdate transport systems ATPase subunit
MLQVKNILFSYQEQATLNNISFTLEKGKSIAIIGESGCGKSTLLKIIYGLYDVDQGKLYWDENEILGPKYHLIPGMDFMKYLAQDFDLMPFITVAENVGKYLSNIYAEKKNERIAALLEIVEMTEYANVKAKNLSGGQMQRVALARVLALEPEVLLLDEPFSHIDNFRKNSLRRKLFSYLKEKEITTIFATHDSADVLSFADELLVLKDGRLIEEGKPKNWK